MPSNSVHGHSPIPPLFNKRKCLESRLVSGRRGETGCHGLRLGMARPTGHTFGLRLLLSSPSLLWALRWLNGREATCDARDVSVIPGAGRSPGEGSGNPLQYCCLGNPRDRGAWGAAAQGVTEEPDMTRRLSNSNSEASGAVSSPHVVLRDQGSRCHEYGGFVRAE